MKGRSMSLWVKKTLYQQVIVPIVTYGAEILEFDGSQKKVLNMIEIKCLRPMLGVTRWYRVQNGEICSNVGIEESLAQKVGRKV